MSHALIVGGTKGTGLEIAKLFISKGNKVSVLGRSAPDPKLAPEGINFWSTDFLKISELDLVIDKVISKNGPVDHVIFSQRYRGSDDNWRGELSVSLDGTKRAIEILTNKFSKNKNKSIVIISSIADNFVVHNQDLSYHVAKSGLVAMTRYFAVKLGTDIRVNCVSPGTIVKEESKEFYSKNERINNIYKEISPIGRMVTSKDVANITYFLSSDSASAITGQHIYADGGISVLSQESIANILTAKTTTSTQDRSKDFFRRKDCRLCGSNKLDLLFKMVDTPIGDKYSANPKQTEEKIYPVELFLCKDCGHVQLLDVLNPEAVYSEYIYKTSDSLGLVKHFENSVSSIISNVKPEKNSLVVDIGSNDGSYLNIFRKNLMTVVGVEPAKQISKIANERGITTINAFFNLELAKKIRTEHGPATIVTSNNTFANIDDLSAFMQGVKTLLSEDGVFVIETGYVLDLLNKKIFDNIYHEHISYFAILPYKKFLEQQGFELMRVERIAQKGGSIRCFAQLTQGKRKVSDSVSEILKLEEQVKLTDSKIFKDFHEYIVTLGNKTKSLLKKLKSEGKTIVGYGASVGVTTALYNFGLDEQTLSFLVDDNKARQNLYSPGKHLCVKNPEKIYDGVDYVIILAWQYSDPIINKHKKFLEQGGKIINILPNLEIISLNNTEVLMSLKGEKK